MLNRTVQFWAFALSVWMITGVVEAQRGGLPPEVIAYADVVLYNGKIITADDQESVVSAVAIRDGKFLAVGDDDRMLGLAGPNTEKINVQGRSVVPGFIDNHGHGSWAGNVSKRGGSGRVTFKDKQSGLQEIKQLVEASPPGTFLALSAPRVRRFYSITRHDIDPITPNNPIYLITAGAEVLANTQALELANIPLDTGGLAKDPTTGQPTGQLVGWAAGIMLYETKPWPPMQELIPEQKRLIAEKNEQGYTMILGRGQGLTISILRDLWLRKELNVRARVTHEFLRLNPNGEAYLKRIGNLSGFGDEWFKIIGTTVMPVDGAAGDGANLTVIPKLRQVEDDPFGGFGHNRWMGYGFGQESAHDWEEFPQELKEKTEWQNIILANRYGWNILSLHSVGDESTRVILKTYELANQEKPFQGRWGIDHQQIQNAETIVLMKKLNVIPSVNYFSESQIYQYGADRASRMSPVKTFIDEGILPTVEPDSTPLMEMEQFITRQGPGEETQDRVFGPQEKLNRLEALYMYTKWGARRSGEEDLVGTIEPGKWGDLVVLGGDFLTVSEDQFCEQLPVLMTMVGGKVVFQTDQGVANCRNPRRGARP